jgi:hypothetical protein
MRRLHQLIATRRRKALGVLAAGVMAFLLARAWSEREFLYQPTRTPCASSGTRWLVMDSWLVAICELDETEIVSLDLNRGAGTSRRFPMLQVRIARNPEGELAVMEGDFRAKHGDDLTEYDDIHIFNRSLETIATFSSPVATLGLAWNDGGWEAAGYQWVRRFDPSSGVQTLREIAPREISYRRSSGWLSVRLVDGEWRTVLWRLHREDWVRHFLSGTMRFSFREVSPSRGERWLAEVDVPSELTSTGDLVPQWWPDGRSEGSLDSGRDWVEIADGIVRVKTLSDQPRPHWGLSRHQLRVEPLDPGWDCFSGLATSLIHYFVGERLERAARCQARHDESITTIANGERRWILARESGGYRLSNERGDSVRVPARPNERYELLTDERARAILVRNDYRRVLVWDRDLQLVGDHWLRFDLPLAKLATQRLAKSFGRR